MRRACGYVVALIAVVMLAACNAENPPERAADPASPFDACPAPATVHAPSTARPSSRQTTLSAIPDVSLPCFTGGQSVNVARLGRPVVVNLWASWCRPCRTELPEFQRFADAAGEKVVVLGVDTGDTRQAAAAAAQDFGIRFPTLFDPDEALRRGLGRTGLPITVFVDADGYVRHVYQASAVLNRSTLDELTREHLGVVVS